jgi:hypothetical protein
VLTILGSWWFCQKQMPNATVKAEQRDDQARPQLLQVVDNAQLSWWPIGLKRTGVSTFGICILIVGSVGAARA